MLTGTEVGSSILTLTGLDREKKLIEIFRAQGLAPNAGSESFRRIVTSMKIGGAPYKLEMDVSPLPAALGTEDDFLLIPAWPWTYQTMADAMDCVIPTRKMVTLVSQQADFRMPPMPISPNSEKSDLYVRVNAAVTKALSVSIYHPGMLVVSPKKDVVTGPALDGTKVAIFGWFFQPGPQADTKEGRIQPYSTIHDSKYVDYSHSWRVFRRVAFLNGKPVSLVDVAKDLKLHVLVSDQGPLTLRFPSKDAKGPGVAVKVVTGAGILGGAAAGAVAGAVVAGPVGAAVGALLGAALGRHA